MTNEPHSASHPSPSEQLKAVRGEFDALVDSHRDLAEPRIESGLRAYLQLVRAHYVAVDARADENRRRCRALLETGRICDDIQKGQHWDNGHFEPLVPIPIAAKVQSAGDLSLDEDEAREVAARCLEWSDFQARVGGMCDDRAAVIKEFDAWKTLHEERADALLDRVSAKPVRPKSALRKWEQRIVDAIAQARSGADSAARQDGRKPVPLKKEALLAYCRYVPVVIAPRFACSTIAVPKHPMHLRLQDYQGLEGRAGIDLCYARLAGLSDALTVPTRWTNTDRVTVSNPTWMDREADALLSLRPINWGDDLGNVPCLHAAALDVEFAQEMLRSVRADLLDAADWISSVEAIRLCGFTPEQLQMAASRGKLVSETRGSLKWYRRSQLRREYPNETIKIL